MPPTLVIEDVCHIGTLVAADKGRRGPSWEGHGLSVSVHPDEWERIAELGGLPWHHLHRDGGRFLDFWELSERDRQAIGEWAVARGLAERVTMWRAEWFDDEVGDTLATLHRTRAEAAAEDTGQVSRTEVFTGTPKLAARLNMPGDGDAFDLLAVCWTEDTTDLDGVWWADNHGFWSAPRGVIFPGKVAGWSASSIAPHSFATDDDR